jgi:hypothetical protein
MFGLDLRSLALFRIGLGLYLLVDLLDRVPDLTAHYTDAGVLPRSALGPPWCLALHRLSGELWWQACLFVVAGVLAVAVLVGYRTRPATLLSWLMLLSLHDRNSDILQGGDQLFRLILFWGFFLPLGARWSLDHWLAERSRKQALSPLSPGGERGANNLVVSGPTVAYLLQICAVYWFAAALKVKYPSWWGENTAVYYALNVASFDTPVGRFLLGLHSAELLSVLTVTTVLLEGLGPFLLFVPLRQGFFRFAVVASFILFHVCLGVCMVLGPFPYVACLAWLAMLPGWTWDRLARLRTRKAEREAEKPVPRSEFRAPSLEEAPAVWVQVLAVVLAVYLLLCNLRSLDPKSFGRYLPEPLDWVGQSFALQQMWGMFTPWPGETSGWYVARGRLRDGSVATLFPEGYPDGWERPAWVSATYPNEHWRKYLMNLTLPGFQRNRTLYARYLCRSWNARHEGDKRVEFVEVYFVLEKTPPDFVPPEPKPLLYCRYYCAGDGTKEE